MPKWKLHGGISKRQLGMDKLISLFVLLVMSFASMGMETPELAREEGLLLADVTGDIVIVEPFNGYLHEFAGSILIALGVTGMSIGTLMAGAAKLDLTHQLCQAGIGTAVGFGAFFVGGTLLYCYSCYRACR